MDIELYKLFNAEVISVVEQYWNNITYSWGNKSVDTSSKSITPKKNAIARFGFELAYYDVASLVRQTVPTYNLVENFFRNSYTKM